MAENMNMPEEAAKQVFEQNKDQILESFNRFKNFLGDQVAKGEKLGMSDEVLAATAKKVADYLAKHEEPRNSEEKVLNELWDVADENEKTAIASALVKMVQKTN